MGTVAAWRIAAMNSGPVLATPSASALRLTSRYQGPLTERRDGGKHLAQGVSSHVGDTHLFGDRAHVVLDGFQPLPVEPRHAPDEQNIPRAG